MDALFSLWTFAPVIKTQLAVVAIVAQIALAIWCYSQMSRARMSAAKAGTVTADIYKAVGDAEPEEIRVYTRLVANQFEAPVLFYALMITGLAVGITSWLTIILAFAFVAFRIVHAREMAGEHVVMRRRRVFIRSMQVLLLMVIELLVSTLLFIQV